MIETENHRIDPVFYACYLIWICIKKNILMSYRFLLYFMLRCLVKFKKLFSFYIYFFFSSPYSLLKGELNSKISRKGSRIYHYFCLFYISKDFFPVHRVYPVTVPEAENDAKNK